jgi:hypothetical protein
MGGDAGTIKDIAKGPLFRADKEVGPFSHFISAQIGNNQFLAVQFMGARFWPHA